MELRAALKKYVFAQEDKRLKIFKCFLHTTVPQNIFHRWNNENLNATSAEKVKEGSIWNGKANKKNHDNICQIRS